MSGEYRSIYSTLPDDDEFIMLSPIAKTMWYTLKMKLSVIGIGRMNPRVLATLVNCSVEQLAEAELELTPKWIRRDGLTWWLQGGLRFHPGLSPKNANHRSFVEKQLASVGKTMLRNAFREAYPEWFSGAEPSQSHSDGSGIPSEGDQDGSQITVDSNTDDGKRDINPEVVRAAAISLSVVANKGLAEHASRPQRIPRIIGSSGASYEAAEAILLAGVTIAFAESHIYELARSHSAERGITSLRYFRDAVIRAWQESQEAEAAKNRAPPRRNGTKPKPAPANPSSAKYADRFK